MASANQAVELTRGDATGHLPSGTLAHVRVLRNSGTSMDGQAAVVVGMWLTSAGVVRIRGPGMVRDVTGHMGPIAPGAGREFPLVRLSVMVCACV